ncbi:TPA: hypothetical protein IUT93_002709 [Enterococcus faecalis]|uniref:hypothetical protein n=1 Tax=Enterococcus faecalis TaxID=1351 RepID=UPI000CF66498|nr:hypothetical protein [Enterococcus faecalis]PQC08927.1 hypothetical protein CUM91_14925 [Enterococcus faecalis]HAP3815362.1 hypothetical protein [Enterococcus faecalis]
MTNILVRVNTLFKYFKLVNFIVGIIFIIIASVFYSLLPNTIPTHLAALNIFDLHPYMINNYGDKLFVFALPIIGLVIGLILNIDFIYNKHGELSLISAFVELLLISTLVFYWIICCGYFFILYQYIL